MTIPRIALAVGLALNVLAAPFAAEAQEAGRVYQIGVLPPGPISPRMHLWNAFRQGLRELGYVEGHTLGLGGAASGPGCRHENRRTVDERFSRRH
ncbi:MAG TPA: hypothetical protein VGQ77_00490, partial [Methylomirabilota bacterium]|nr:hypothetical protein [Methylomirabilota bacterium]